MGTKTSFVSFCCRWRKYSPCLCLTCVTPTTAATHTFAQGRSTDTLFRCFAMESIAFGAWQQWHWTTPWSLSSLSHPYSNTVMMSKDFVITALTLNFFFFFLLVCFSTQLCVFKNLWLMQQIVSQTEVLWVQRSNQWFQVSVCHITDVEIFAWKTI